MLLRIKNLYQSLRNIGIHNALSSTRTRNIRYINSASTIIFLLVLFPFVDSLLIGDYGSSCCIGIMMLLLLITVGLNHLRQYKLAKLIAVIQPFLFVIAGRLIAGPNMNVELMVLTSVLLPIFIIDSPRIWFKLPVVAVGLLLYALVHGDYLDPYQMGSPPPRAAYVILSLSIIIPAFLFSNLVNGLRTSQVRLEKNFSKLEQLSMSLSDSLEERETLLKEIHHRVKNNLQVISSLMVLQGARIKDESLKTAFNDSQHRITSMGLIHELLYQSKNMARIDMQAYIEKLVKYFEGSSLNKNNKVSTELDLHKIELDLDTAIPMGLILNEMLTNSLKYAFPNEAFGTVRIGLRRTGDSVELSFSDNGVGVAGDVNIEKSDSLGFKLIHKLSAQIKGKLHVDTANGVAYSLILNS